MIRLTESMRVWGTPGFDDALKRELESIDAAQLPLQQGLSTTSYATDARHQVMINSVREEADLIRVRAGIFYQGIIAGCSCADDPTPIDEHSEYCEVRIDIDKRTAQATVSLLDV